MAVSFGGLDDGSTQAIHVAIGLQSVARDQRCCGEAGVALRAGYGIGLMRLSQARDPESCHSCRRGTFRRKSLNRGIASRLELGQQVRGVHLRARGIIGQPPQAEQVQARNEAIGSLPIHQ
ncbi:hypothetical protein [Sphingomonas sp. DBB INV C78]|uniref:hypothetical protein n=1 Tax=Sphingomonas sp. DBB INV C78 TaxID=3349434 RepID=UPI0036D2934A